MSSGFITETELAEQRKARQEEWEKVRKPDEPEEAPEQQYDHRSLFERLEEQKNKRELEYEETHKLKNMIRGLDDDEVDFLDLVEKSKMDAELKTSRDEARELKEYRDAVAKAEEASLEHRIKTEIKARPITSSSGSSSRSSQGRLLAGAVVRKRPAEGPAEVPVEAPAEAPAEVPVEKKTKVEGVAMTCIGILPGLGSYPDSSDSEGSSDTDQEILVAKSQLDLLGRKIQRPKSNASH